MTEKVWIAIKGNRRMDGEQEQVDETGLGEYYKRNGKHYIIWHCGESMTKRIKITGNSMTVSESNGGNAMNFQKETESRTFYGTSEGKVALGIRTHEFFLKEKEELLEVEVEYSLYYEGSHMSDNCMKVTIASLDVPKAEAL